MPLTSSEAEDFRTLQTACYFSDQNVGTAPKFVRALERIQANYERMAEGQPRRLYPHPGVESPS